MQLILICFDIKTFFLTVLKINIAIKSHYIVEYIKHCISINTIKTSSKYLPKPLKNRVFASFETGYLKC